MHGFQRVRRIENARISTFARDGAATASTIDFRDGRVLALDQPDRGAPDDGVVLDAAGRSLLPGLIDSHQHTLLGGLSLLQLDLSAVRSPSAFRDMVAAHARTLSPSEWLEAAGWSEENWADHQLPDRRWLAGCGDRPAVCWRMDHHACVVNDVVLARLESEGKLAADPPGGRIVRDPRGAATGLLLEAAAWTLVRPLLPAPTAGRKRAALAAAQDLLLRLGLTSVMSMELRSDLQAILEPARATLAPRMLVTLLESDLPSDLDYASAFLNDDRLVAIGHKAFIDGTLGSRTARLLEPYADDPGNRGLFVERAAAGNSVGDDHAPLFDWAHRVTSTGLSPSMHAIGDAALRLAIDVVLAMPPELRRAVRPRIEHAQTAHPDDVGRCRELFLSMQPLHKADDGRFAERRLGAARLDRFFPFRSFLKAGARLAFGSDWPIVSPDPMLGVQAAVTGRTLDGTVVGAAERLSPREALAAYTSEAAAMLGADGAHFMVGQLRPGAVADCVLFDEQPESHDWTRPPPRAGVVVIGGERVVW